MHNDSHNFIIISYDFRRKKKNYRYLCVIKRKFDDKKLWLRRQHYELPIVILQASRKTPSGQLMFMSKLNFLLIAYIIIKCVGTIGMPTTIMQTVNKYLNIRTRSKQ